MPRRNDIKSILIVGSGPIIIGQGCEFDYSGAQACKALREEGYRVILLNSNPATIMTDPEISDATYIEPLTVDTINHIHKKENFDAFLPTVGGQLALNLAMEISKIGIDKQLGFEMIGVKPDAIEKAENRKIFQKEMLAIGLDCPLGYEVSNIEEGILAAENLGFPIIIRSSFTLGGKGSRIIKNKDQLMESISIGLRQSPISQVIMEEYLEGWKEYEMEIIRDSKDNCAIICSIENIEPMGIHTGDSITVAPALTLTDKEYQVMRESSFAIMRTIGVDTGGSNVQFAVHPTSGRMVVIEMNPRVSRSSALASKATGYPIAKIAAKVAVGFTLDEIDNEITTKTKVAFEPSIDYIVTKIPRFDFQKFPEATRALTSSMQSVGEVMAIGRTFAESLQKALRSMECDWYGLEEVDLKGNNSNQKLGELKKHIATPTPERIFYIAQGFRMGLSIEEVHALCFWDKWFLNEISKIVSIELSIQKGILKLKKENLLWLKSYGFSDYRLGKLFEISEEEIRSIRYKLGVRPYYRRVDTCAAEFSSNTAYMYSYYHPFPSLESYCEAGPSDKKKVIIIGSGPNHIGQGIEFDYSCVHASYAVREMGYESIMINCNPETVSTDHTSSDRLYFTPLILEDVLEVIDKESQKGEVLGVILQFGGRSSLKFAAEFKRLSIPIIGTSYNSIEICEARNQFNELLQSLNIKQIPHYFAHNQEDLEQAATSLGYPIIIRPSYIIGGKNMHIIYSEEELIQHAFLKNIQQSSPLLIEKFLNNATECEIDGVSDGEELYIAGIMEHFEKAGIHSGDSTCIIPTYSIPQEIIDKCKIITKKIIKTLSIKGLVNIQFAIKDGEIYLIEVNPRASRTVPFVAKATGVALPRIATKIMLGEPMKNFSLNDCFPIKGYAIKKPIFSFASINNAQPRLGPEMKSTGESMSIGTSPVSALIKNYSWQSLKLKEGNLIIYLETNNLKIVFLLQKYYQKGLKIYTTYATYALLSSIDESIESYVIPKEPDEIKIIIQSKEIMFCCMPEYLESKIIQERLDILNLCVQCAVPIILSEMEILLFITLQENKNYSLNEVVSLQERVGDNLQIL